MSMKKEKKISIKIFFEKYLVALKSKALFFDYAYNTANKKKIETLLMCLEKNSRITGYFFFSPSLKVRIFLHYDSTQKKPLLPKIMYPLTKNQFAHLTVKVLKKFHLSHQNSLLLVETKDGVKDHKDCLLSNQGGAILVALT